MIHREAIHYYVCNIAHHTVYPRCSPPRNVLHNLLDIPVNIVSCKSVLDVISFTVRQYITTYAILPTTLCILIVSLSIMYYTICLRYG